MSLFFSPSDQYAPGAKAPQACGSCKRQKRKCDKALPTCGLCTRMERQCDYAETPQPGPTADDFAALQLKLLELESRLRHSDGTPSSSVNGAPAAGSDSALGSGGSVGETPPTAPVYTPLEPLWEQQTAAQYPPDVFLDITAFDCMNLSLPKPVIDIPVEVLEQLGDGNAIQQLVGEYFATIHASLPIVSKKRMHMGHALGQGGPDLAMLFLAMKLATTQPADGVAAAHHAIYRTAKRFMSSLEHGGATSLMVLQSMVLIAYFEFGHGIYPSAWTTVGACVRFVDFLGLPRFYEGNILLSSPTTWTELEERSRTWWAVIVLDRVICLGNKKRYLSPEPEENEIFPVDDEAWDEGRVGRAVHRHVSQQPADTPSFFSSLCRAALLAGNVITHVRRATLDRKQNQPACAAQHVAEANSLSDAISSAVDRLPRSLAFLAPRCVLLSAGVLLHDFYCCPVPMDGRIRPPEEITQQFRSVELLRAISDDVAALSEELLSLALAAEKDDEGGGGGGIGAMSPLVLDALYGAANTFAWLVREEGPAENEDKLEVIKRCLARLGARWRLAGEYGRMLEQQDMAFMMQEKGHQMVRYT